MRRAALVGVLMLLALPAWGSGQEIWVEFECVTNQAGITIPMFSVEGRPGAEFTVNGQTVGAVLNGGYGVNGENTWTATALPGYELTSPNTGVVTLDCGGFETADGYHPDCERYPQKCNTTTTTTIPADTTTTSEGSSSTTTSTPDSTTSSTTPSTTPTSSTTTSTLPAETTAAPTEPTTTTALATSLTSQPPSTADPSVAPADIELPDTGLSHNLQAGLIFAGFVLLTMGGMAVLAGRDDE